MKLTVLAGAKTGAAVPIKKDSFVIGRSKECALRAGSDAISRRHCELKVTAEGVTVEDLGSRNGTYVNEEKVEGVKVLTNGDKLRVGPLEFRYDAEGELKKAKQPKIASVGEAVARASESPRDGSLEDSISDWLINEMAAAPAVGETISMRTDETQIGDDEEDAVVPPTEESADSEGEDGEAEVDGEEVDNKGKKKPGKLPFRPTAPQAKDSREAAAQVLRDMARRR